MWALFYASPVILFFVSPQQSGPWVDLIGGAVVVFGIVSVIHAFFVRKEYLLRLDMLQREMGAVSVTSSGKRWELLHSLWIAWTFTFGLLGWIAFIYVGVRAKRPKWVSWGVLYAVPLVLLIIVTEVAPGSSTESVITGVTVVSGFFSIVHALLIRNDYLMSLENLKGQGVWVEQAREVDRDSSSRHTLEKEDSSRPASAPIGKELKQSSPPEPPESAEPEGTAEPEPEVPHESVPEHPPFVGTPDLAPVEVRSEGSNASHELWISESYPLPLAYSWSLIAGLWDPNDRYRAQLRHAENMLAYLGCVSLALLEEADYETAKIDLTKAASGGISFGTWKLIVQMSAKALHHKDHSLASAICGLKIGSEQKGFGADVVALISARNDFHHGRGPVTEEEIAGASDDTQDRLQRCMKTLSFLREHPIRLVQDFDPERRTGKFWLKCLRLEGDGPGFPQERVRSPEVVPRGDLLLDLGNQNWRPLYPFVLASNCSRCQHRETYFLDQWKKDKDKTLLKSFERGHIEERSDIAEALGALVEQKSSVS